MPNGNAIIETYVNPSEEDNRERAIYYKWSGKVEKGIYVGFWNAIYRHNDGYHEFDNISFVNGQAQKIGTMRSGRDIHADCVQCGSDYHLCLDKGVYGIAGCY